jgi:hypothetical protein
LSAAEREKFGGLSTEAERDAFRILRNWAQTEKPDFYISCESLGKRLGISLCGASKLRRKFCELRILRQTAQYVPNKLCALFQWIGNAEPTRKQAALMSLQQWNGDPGDAHLKGRRAKG